MSDGKPVVLGGTPIARSAPAQRWPAGVDQEISLLEKVVRSGEWGLEGPFQAEFERRFANLHTARFGLCVANGTVALQLALEALGVGAGDEVIVPGLTWQATAASVIDTNAVPILVDIDPETYCLDPEAAEAAVTPRTKAIVVVHLYAGLADMDRILDVARRHGLYVVEDCAHAHGSRWNGRGVGSLGDVGCFSFQSAKTLTAGEGGFVTTNDESLREALYSLRNCGRRREGADPSAWRPIQSGNYRMTEWQAAVLCAQLERFEEQMLRREENARYLDEEWKEIPGVSPVLTLPQVTRRNMYRYVFRYRERDFGNLKGRAFRKALSEDTGIDVRAPYEPLNGSPLYRPQTKQRHRLSRQYWERIDPARFRLPVAERAYATEAMIVSHEVMLEDRGRLGALPSAVERLRSHLPELLRWQDRSW